LRLLSLFDEMEEEDEVDPLKHSATLQKLLPKLTPDRLEELMAIAKDPFRFAISCLMFPPRYFLSNFPPF
jgi:hypothetical protein